MEGVAFSEFRTRLAASCCYFYVACDISTGNPFIAPWADTIRYGIDIGNGTWKNIVSSAFTGTFLLHIGRRSGIIFSTRIRLGC